MTLHNSTLLHQSVLQITVASLQLDFLMKQIPQTNNKQSQKTDKPKITPHNKNILLILKA